jgi:hypothetical protein
MKTLICIGLSFVALAMFSIVSCTDHQFPEETQWRLKSLTRVLPENTESKFVSEFSYNPDGRIAYIFTYQAPDSAGLPTEKSIYQYDHSGRLSQMERALSSLASERYVYSYNQAGQGSAIHYTGATNDYYDLTFKYDGTGKLQNSRRYFEYFHTLSYEQLISYSFSHDNLSSIHAETTVVRAVPGTSITNTEFVYDDHKNPFYGTYIIPAPVKIASPPTGNFQHYTYAGGIDNLLHLSKNNLTSSNIKGLSQTNYTYTYHVSGMPESRMTWVKAMLDRPEVLQETLYTNTNNINLA